MQIVYLIEIESDGRWTPMYIPCYSRPEAERKQKAKARLFGLKRTRVVAYVPQAESQGDQEGKA